MLAPRSWGTAPSQGRCVFPNHTEPSWQTEHDAYFLSLQLVPLFYFCP